MNDLQKAYCDGASMAYRDAAEKLAKMRRDAPEEVSMLFEALIPLEAALIAKSGEVYREVERLLGVRH